MLVTVAVSEMTTAELQRTARAVIRAYLDQEAGRGGLGRYLAADAAAGLEVRSPRPASATGVRHADVGPVSVLRLGPDRAFAVAAAPEARAGGGAVLGVELVAEGGRLRAVRVGRLAESGRPRAFAREAPAVGDGQPLPVPPAHLTGLLGALPDDPEARLRWLTAAAVIDTYRERYDISDAHTALGPQPVDAEQRAARDRALEYARALVAEIDRIEPDRPSREAGREQPRGPELGR